MTTRSKTLYLNKVALPTGTRTVLYTVPASRRTIIRSVTIIQGTGAALNVLERLKHSGTTATVRVITTANNVVDVFEVWRVLESGDEYSLEQSSGSSKDVTVHLSGAELVV